MPPSYSPCPRPILKRSTPPHPLPAPHDEPSTLLAIDPSILSPLVRFPPQPSLAHTLGNALPYDRSPIVVVPNRCALPERGCPGRTYSPDDPSSPRRTKHASLSPTRGKHLHPRAVADNQDLRPDDDPTPTQSPRDDFHPLPPLIPDLSSESSEESDGIASPPLEFYHASIPSKMSLEQSLMNLTLAGTNAPSTSALSFLPHPPSPRVRPHHSPSTPPSHSPSNSQSYVVSGLSNPNASHSASNNRASSPVRSRSPSSSTHSRRKSRPQTIPVPSASAATACPTPCQSSIPSVSPKLGMSSSPERERRSRLRDGRECRDHRERSRERRERERDRAERLARYRSLTEASSRMSGFGIDDSGCLGGF